MRRFQYSSMSVQRIGFVRSVLTPHFSAMRRVAKIRSLLWYAFTSCET